MANTNQHLKHGKALCGAVFAGFVETFNALVDFMMGLRGDADGKNGEGHITYDRKNNIIRCDGCGGKGGGSGSDAVLPWTFICTVSKDENGNETRRGGWYYGQAQLGLDAAWFGELGLKYPLYDLSGRILHCDQTADGNYYLEVRPGYPKIELKRFGLKENRPTNDPVEDKWFVYIGTVVDAKQVFGIHCVPVIYEYI